ncbi:MULTISPECIES: 6-hydroxymethylpterin diphosphokinase MptE-like protein [Marinobacter]|uniref:6-hydroxymethylpterin diphosphokinase MptE-like protein n=1 Tax=Marinobacter sp. KM021 TaxID=3075616 RepID=UPI003D6ABDA3
MSVPNADGLLRFLRSAYRDDVTSLRRLAILKFLYFLKGGLYCFRFYKERRIGKAKFKQCCKSKKDKAFVFANGPSLSDIDFRKVKEYQASSYDVITINSFSSKAIDVHGIVPDFCVFGDPYHFHDDDIINDQASDDIEMVNKHGIPAFVPMHLFSRSRFLNSIPFCSVSNPYSKNVSNCFRPLGYYPTTAFYALSIAIFLGYEEVRICGFDNSYFLNFTVDKNGNKYFVDKHFYDRYPKKRHIDSFLFPKTSHVFLNFSRHFRYLEKISDGFPGIKNVAKVTYTDAFPIDFSLDIYREKV